jgi:hypothetical protein
VVVAYLDKSTGPMVLVVALYKNKKHKNKNTNRMIGIQRVNKNRDKDTAIEKEDNSPIAFHVSHVIRVKEFQTHR